MTHPMVDEHMLQCKTTWQFNVERAPWWGEVFERMIQSVKRLLRKIIGTAKLTFDELTTAVIEVECLLNSRPLTLVSTDEVQQPLTPSHFINGCRIMSFPDVPLEEGDEDLYVPHALSEADHLTKRMKHLSYTIERFWLRWRSEYLLELRNSHRSNMQQRRSTETQIVVGDVVIVEDNFVKRGFWRLGVVSELLLGRDKLIRAASVKTHSKDGKLIVLKRPLQKLYPLEVTRAIDPTEESNDQTTTVEESSPHIEDAPRPKRNAAVQARNRMKTWINDLTDT